MSALGTSEMIDCYFRAHPKTHNVLINCPKCGKAEADVIDVLFSLHPTCNVCGEFATEILSVIERNAA